jgi:uncharacterized membrane protein YdjX (TVP38/TMEM64 family)
MPTEMVLDPKQLRKQKALKWALGIFMLAMIVVSATQLDNILPYVITVLNWAEDVARKPGGPILFTLMYTAATVLFLPGGLICVGIGFAFQRAYDSMYCKKYLKVLTEI